MNRNQHAGRRSSGGFSLNVFTAEELEDIHLATLEVLERAGIWCDDPEALAIFAGGGCRVDRDTMMVRIPAHVVEEAIDSAPSTFADCGRDEAYDIVFEPGRVGFTTFGEGLMVVDTETGELRASTRADVAATALLADYLDGIDAYEVAVGASDVSAETAEIHNYAAAVGSCRKHICSCPIGGWETKKVIEIAAAVSGGREALRARPIVTLGMCPVSPLKLPKECSEVIVEAARAGLPANILSMAMAGASAPVTLAGTLVTHNAEVLSGIVLSQLTEKGAKVFYGSSTTAMDLRLASASVGTPECAMINAGVACLARQYRLPSYVAGL
jgi:trimethylamine---corrinoid protein Co-methyltransferase